MPFNVSDRPMSTARLPDRSPKARRTGAGPHTPRTRRERLTGRALPVIVLALAAFAGGAVLGARHEPADRKVATRFSRRGSGATTAPCTSC